MAAAVSSGESAQSTHSGSHAARAWTRSSLFGRCDAKARRLDHRAESPVFPEHGQLDASVELRLARTERMTSVRAPLELEWQVG